MSPTGLRPLQGTVFWLTGLPAAGKSTLARALHDALREEGVPVLWMDSDDLRRVLTPEPTYASDERERFYRALGHLAILAASGGVTTIVSATAHRRVWRDAVRASVPRFVEVLVACDAEVLRARDPKGIYAAADAGLLTTLPGRGVAYEPPAPAEIVVDTTRLGPAEALRSLLAGIARLPRGSSQHPPNHAAGCC